MIGMIMGRIRFTNLQSHFHEPTGLVLRCILVTFREGGAAVLQTREEGQVLHNVIPSDCNMQATFFVQNNRTGLIVPVQNSTVSSRVEGWPAAKRSQILALTFSNDEQRLTFLCRRESDEEDDVPFYQVLYTVALCVITCALFSSVV
jgi:hypothetical protein